MKAAEASTPGRKDNQNLTFMVVVLCVTLSKECWEIIFRRDQGGANALGVLIMNLLNKMVRVNCVVRSVSVSAGCRVRGRLGRT